MNHRRRRASPFREDPGGWGGSESERVTGRGGVEEQRGGGGAQKRKEAKRKRGLEVGERDKVRAIGEERRERKEPEKRGDGKWSRSLASIDGWDWPWQAGIREK